MKHRSVLLLLATLLAAFLCSCGNSNTDTSSSAPGVSQSEYDALEVQNENLKAENDRLTGELEEANAKIEELQKNEIPVSAAPTEVEVLVHDDEYVTISFIGCEMDRDDQNIVFMITNKTDSELSFQSGSMAIDGISLGHVRGSDSIAAQSKGKVRFETKEEFPTMSPSTISGTIKVIDFEKTLWDSQSYEVSFSNLDVAA